MWSGVYKSYSGVTSIYIILKGTEIRLYYINYFFLFNYLWNYFSKHKYIALLFSTLMNVHFYGVYMYIFIVRQYYIYQRIAAPEHCISRLAFDFSRLQFRSARVTALSRVSSSCYSGLYTFILSHEWCQVERRANSSPDNSYAS